MARKPKQDAEAVKEPLLAVEIGRMAKILALYMLKDVDEEGRKVSTLRAVGYSATEIADLLNKTEGSVRKAITRSQS